MRPGVQTGKSRSMSPGRTVGARQRLAGPHPVAVALHGVDLAVVGDDSGRDGPAATTGRCWWRTGSAPAPGPIPSARRSGREEVAQLGRGEHALVDEGPRRQAGEVDAGSAVAGRARARCACGPRRPDVRGRALDRALRPARRPAGTTAWRRGPRARASRLHGNVTPAQHPQALAGGQLLDRPGTARRLAGLRRGGRRCRWRSARRPAARSRTPRARKAIGHLDQDPGTVTGVDLGARSAPVLQVLERRPVPRSTMLVGLAAVHVDDEGRPHRRRVRSGGRTCPGRRGELASWEASRVGGGRALVMGSLRSRKKVRRSGSIRDAIGPDGPFTIVGGVTGCGVRWGRSGAHGRTIAGNGPRWGDAVPRRDR